jgi:hypothetical protein
VLGQEDQVAHLLEAVVRVVERVPLRGAALEMVLVLAGVLGMLAGLAAVDLLLEALALLVRASVRLAGRVSRGVTRYRTTSSRTRR